MTDAALTKYELTVVNRVKQEVCRIIDIPFQSNYNTGVAVGAYVKPLHTNIFMIIQQMKQLQMKYGDGVLMMIFKSVKAFQQLKCIIPFPMKSHIRKDWIISNKNKLFYVPNDALNFWGITPPKVLPHNEQKKKNLFLALIYDNFPKSQVFVSYNSFFYNADELAEFFRRKRWSATVLRKKYSAYLDVFQQIYFKDLLFLVHQAIAKMFSMLVGIAKFYVPEGMLDYVADTKKHEQIREIMDKLYDQCNQKPMPILIRLKEAQLTQLMDADVDVVEVTFIFDAINKIEGILGVETYCGCYCKCMQEQFGFKASMLLWRLIKRIEGQKCSYCYMQERRNNDVIEKYKMCSGCREAYYCSRKCQKRDWIKVHRYKCNK